MNYRIFFYTYLIHFMANMVFQLVYHIHTSNIPYLWYAKNQKNTLKSLFFLMILPNLLKNL